MSRWSIAWRLLPDRQCSGQPLLFLALIRFLCFAIQGPFAGLAPFWAIPAETMPRLVVGTVMGLVNAIAMSAVGRQLRFWLAQESNGRHRNSVRCIGRRPHRRRFIVLPVAAERDGSPNLPNAAA